uniref:Uncharacterized protein n=1 Tax=Acrobeloides nanus TaxID=290746 RepID=A0A914DKZ9_9BILA
MADVITWIVDVLTVMVDVLTWIVDVLTVMVVFLLVINMSGWHNYINRTIKLNEIILMLTIVITKRSAAVPGLSILSQENMTTSTNSSTKIFQIKFFTNYNHKKKSPCGENVHRRTYRHNRRFNCHFDYNNYHNSYCYQICLQA